jgi:hypothetical protein
MTTSNESSLPSYPKGPTTPTANSTAVRPPVPTQVNVAFWLYIVAAVISLASVVIVFATIGLLRAAARSQLASRGASLTSSQLDAAVTAGIIVSVVVAVVFLAAYILFAVFLRRGANWARIVLLVLTVLSLLSVTSDYGIGALRVAVGIVATILVFLKPASDYFRDVKASKQVVG